MYACFVSIVLVVVFVLLWSVVVLLLVVRYTLSGFLRCSITFVTHARTRQCFGSELEEVLVLKDQIMQLQHENKMGKDLHLTFKLDVS